MTSPLDIIKQVASYQAVFDATRKEHQHKIITYLSDEQTAEEFDSDRVEYIAIPDVSIFSQFPNKPKRAAFAPDIPVRINPKLLPNTLLIMGKDHQTVVIRGE
jgi:hypothetical protein